MKGLLPKKLGNYYDDDYILKAKHINVPWMLKGLKKY